MRRHLSRFAGPLAIALGIVLASTLGATSPAAAQGPAPPNILVIFGDDIGWMNLSSYGGDIMGVQTPNIDRLAREGLRLTAFYAQPSCTAGRVAFLTNLLMDPFERQTGDVNRQYQEHKTWVLTPIIGIAEQHLATFKDFPVRQVGLSADVGKTLEGIQSQILKLQQSK